MMQRRAISQSSVVLVLVSWACGCAQSQSEDLGRFVDAALQEGNHDSPPFSPNSGGSAGNRPSTSGNSGSAGTPEQSGGAGGSGGNEPGDAGVSGAGTSGGGSGGQTNSEPDAGDSPGGSYESNFSVSYQVEINGASSSYVGAQLQIWNFGFESAPLSEFTLRYYYTNEIGAAAKININWGNVDNGGAAAQIAGNIVVSEHEMPTPRLASGADYYLEFSFNTSEVIEDNGKVTFSWQMDAPPQQTYTQQGDYSFDASKSTLSEWDHVVLYRNGQGAWGVEP